MSITVRLDDRQVTLKKPLTILTLLEQEERRLFRPSVCREQDWINNPRCPLVNLIEVDGQVVPLAVWSCRPVREGMVIRTWSAQLESVLQERLIRLRDHQECQIIRLSQEFAAAESESSRLVDLEQRAKWNFDPRVSPPSIHHDPKMCVRCKGCVDTCNEVQGVGALSFDEKDGILFDETKCTRCGQCILSCPMGFRRMPSAPSSSGVSRFW